MYLDSLDKENKKPFLNLCNMFIKEAKNASQKNKAVEIVKAYCREMEIPYSETTEGTFKRTAFGLADSSDWEIISFALVPIVKLTRTRELMEEFLKYADIDIEDEYYEEYDDYEYQYGELEDVLIDIKSNRGLINDLEEENKKPFLNLCNWFVKEGNPSQQNEAAEIVQTYCCEMEIPYSKTAEGTFKRTAFELAESVDCGTIAFALIPIVRLTETEELMETFLKYADMEDEFEDLGDQYDSLEDALAEIEGLSIFSDSELAKHFAMYSIQVKEETKNETAQSGMSSFIETIQQVNQDILKRWS